MTAVRNIYFEQNGMRFEARPDTVGTDSEELSLLAWMGALTPERRSRLASLQDNVRHACEMLLTAETVGSA